MKSLLAAVGFGGLGLWMLVSFMAATPSAPVLVEIRPAPTATSTQEPYRVVVPGIEWGRPSPTATQDIHAPAR